MMKSAVFYGLGDIRLESRALPDAGPGELVVEIGAAGICATDVRIFSAGHHRIPEGTARVLGHEFAGRILEVGRGVKGLAQGQRVAVAPNIGCGTCPQCVSGWTNLCPRYEAYGITLDGAFAPRLLVTAETVRQGNVVPLPERMPLIWGALAEPLSCCLNGQEAVGLGPTDVVLIIGAGPLGLMHALLAKNSGARTVILSEVAEDRLRLASAIGADLLINPAQSDLPRAVKEASQGDGASVVIVAAPSSAAQAQALELAAPRGRVNFFGGLPKNKPTAEINSNLIHYKQLLVTGTTGSNVRQYRATVELLAAGRCAIQPLIGEVLPLERVIEGIERTRAGKEMRLLLDPQA